MKNKRLCDCILIFSLFAAALGIFFAARLISSPGMTVRISLGDKVYAELPLYQDAELDVDGHLTVTVSGGKAWVKSSECKNQICVRHPAIKNSGEAIVCLPAGITVKIVGGKSTDFLV